MTTSDTRNIAGNDKQFGSGPLSDPVVLEAAACFVPIAIYNNIRGNDAEVLKQFKEPAWNNPVVRFVDADGKDLIPRKGGVYTKEALLERMAQALTSAGQYIDFGLIEE